MYPYMKNKIIYLLVLSSVLLAGCFKQNNPSSSSNNQSSSGEQSSSEEKSSSSSSENTRPKTGTTTIEVYSTNDFHGAVEENGYEVGLARWGTFLKNKNQSENTLLIDQGDTWQGSIYSNFNKGALLTDVMNYVKFDARSVGNHDFDWGQEYIAINKNREYEGYTTPTLAGNVYDYDFEHKIEGTHQVSNLGATSVTYVLENEVKVGILGGIGTSQLTSICSSFTRDICFKNHVQFIKDEATKLRNDEHCDIIIASIHAPQDEVMYNGLSSYVDLVLCGHSHAQETGKEGDLNYIQTYAKGQSIGKTTITFDYATNKKSKVVCSFIDSDTIKANTSTIDTTVQGLINQYNNQSKTEREEVLANNVSGSFYSSGSAANLMCRAIFDKATASGYNIDIAMTNYARENLVNPDDPTTLTYTDLYRSFPFDNTIYIAEITGDEFMKELGYNYMYRNPSFTTDTIYPTQKYKVAVIDYLYLHINENHIYDYFSETGGSSTTTLNKNYREILRDWLRAGNYAKGTSLSAYDYTNSQWAHNKNNFHKG